MHLLSFEAPQQPKNAIRKIMAPKKCYLSVVFRLCRNNIPKMMMKIGVFT